MFAMKEINMSKHWEVARLGTVTEIIKGGTPSRSVDEYFQGNIAWAIPSDITALDSALYIHDTASHISEEGLSKSAAKLLPSGTVLLTSRATIGETAIATIPMATNQGFSNFICNDEILNIYLAYYLRHIKKKLYILASGSTFKEVTKGTLLNVEIPLPPLPEQRAIAHILHTIQEAKFTRQREIALERERKAALMDFLFSHGTKGEPRKQTEIGEMPESWEVINLEKLCECLDSKRVPIKQSERNDRKGKVPYYGASGQIDWIDDYLFDESLLLVAEDGENLVSRKLPIAYSIEGQSWVNNHAHVLRVIDINQFYLEYYFNSFDLSPYLTGTTRPKLNKTSLLDISVPRPSSEETDRIALMLVSCDTKIAALEREVELIDELFHAMLEELMTGQRSAVPLVLRQVIIDG